MLQRINDDDDGWFEILFNQINTEQLLGLRFYFRFQMSLDFPTQIIDKWVP